MKEHRNCTNCNNYLEIYVPVHKTLLCTVNFRQIKTFTFMETASKSICDKWVKREKNNNDVRKVTDNDVIESREL